MKKHYFKFLCLCVSVAATIFNFTPIRAAHVSPQQALARVQGTQLPMRAKSMQHGMELATIYNQVYVFSNDEGFMILPSDDNAPAVLGYSHSGKYVKGENPQLDYWLEFYSRQIKFASSQPSIFRSDSSDNQRSPISPLVKTEWNQEAPYNDLCPKVNGHETVTGCVATAMAQVIRTHRHPYRPTGTHSYNWHAEYRGFTVDSVLTCNYDSLSFVFDDMPYKYDKSSTDVQKHAVAQLMLACGISVDMGYNIGDSGASTMKMGTSLIEHFKYDKSIWMPMRNYYGLSEWEEMIYNDLAKGLPVLYAGYGTAGGHQFICDGYDGDGYFHFNWGWGGMSNGYFLLDALNPNSLGVGGGAGGFNYNQQITLNVTPEQPDSKYTYLVYCGGFKTNDTIPEPGNQVIFGGTYFNFSLHTIPAGTYYGIEIISSTNDTTFVRGSEAMKLAPLYGQDNFSVEWPMLNDGVYTVKPMLLDEYGQWSDIKSPLDGHGSYTAVVNDGITTLTQSELPQPKASALSLNSKLYTDAKCGISFTVTNDGTSEYIWNVAPALLNDSGMIVAIAPALEVDLAAKGSRVIDNYVTTFTPVSTTTSQLRNESPILTPGTYTLTIINNANKSDITDVADRIQVSMETKPAVTEIEISDFEVNHGVTVAEGSSVEFKFKLYCKEGYVDENVYVFIFKDGGDGYDVMSHTYQAPLLSAGESEEEVATVNLSSLGEGTYRAYVYYGDSFEGDPAIFSIRHSTVSVDELLSDPSAQKIYNLKGIRLNKIPVGVPIIVNGKRVLITEQ